MELQNKSIPLKKRHLASYIITLWLDSEGGSCSFLVPTVDGTDGEGVAYPQIQSRAAVIFIVTQYPFTGAGGRDRTHSYTITLHIILRGER